MLSKSRYIRGKNCPKSLWLYVNKKEEQLYSGARLAVFARGTNVGELAQQYFPDGKMAVLEDYPSYASAQRTQEFIINGVETIYEATFIYDDTLVAVDILHKVNGQWCLYEVKSTNSTKPEHIADVAVQYYVVNGSGLSVIDACVMHFNNTYVRRGPIEVHKLFTADSIIEKVLNMQEDIKNNIPLLRDILDGDEPLRDMGSHCMSPYHCDFYAYCSALLPKTEGEAVELSSVPEVNTEPVKQFVANIQYPVAHLDFETMQPGIPMFDESRPYQQIPFQYSMHIQDNEHAALRHYEYLAECHPNVDPRLALIKQMIEETKEAKTIFVYSIGFERTRVRELIRDFPPYAEALNSIAERMVDMIIPFRRNYRTESMEGSASIKKVLPALCPDLSYSSLNIGDGLTAANTFLGLYYCTDPEIIAKTRKDLLAYCHLDTLAMVRLFDVLKKV